MAIYERILDSNPYSWSTINAGTGDITNTTVIGNNYVVYVTGIVNTSQKNINYKVGQTGVQWQNLPYKLPVYIEIAANTNVSTYNFNKNGNCLIFHNTSATARTITLDGSTSFLLPAYGTAIWRYNTAWWNENNSESGTYTPTLSFSGGNTGITYSVNNGTYYKTGKLITFSLNIILTSKGTDTGTIRLSLPFVSTSTADYRAALTVFVADTTHNGHIQSVVANSSSVVNLNSISTTGTTITLTDANITNTSTLRVSGSYLV